MKDARIQFQELQRDRADSRRQHLNSNNLQASFTEANSDSNIANIVSQAEGLVATFETVSRPRATPHTMVRKILMRVLNLTTVQCGCLMGK